MAISSRFHCIVIENGKKVWPVPSSYLAKDDDEVPRTHTDFILRLEFLFIFRAISISKVALLILSRLLVLSVKQLVEKQFVEKAKV